MSYDDNLKTFLEKILALRPPSQILGGGIPLAVTAKSDIVVQLKYKASELGALIAHNSDRGTINAKAREVEGLLLMSSTISIIPRLDADTLIDDLRSLVED